MAYGILKKLKYTQQQINGAWWPYLLHHVKFKCLKPKTVYNEFTGAHATEKTEVCPIAKLGKNCTDKACKHYAWKVKDEELQGNLNTLVNVRNDLLVSYFWFFRKCRELKEYQAAKELVKQKSRERLHNTCTRVCDFGDEDSDAESVQQNDADMQRVAEEYVAALAQRNEARAKFWGRVNK